MSIEDLSLTDRLVLSLLYNFPCTRDRALTVIGSSW